MLKSGFHVTAIRPPTVPPNSCRYYYICFDMLSIVSISNFSSFFYLFLGKKLFFLCCSFASVFSTAECNFDPVKLNCFIEITLICIQRCDFAFLLVCIVI